MREATLAMVLPTARVESEAQPQVCPDDGVVALIAEARRGDAAAFDQLMRRHERMVLMTALRFLNGNLADAQDAAQTVFLRLHRSLGQFRSDASFSGWLYRITVNVCHDINRRSQRRAEVDLSGVARTLAADAADAAADFAGDERRMEAVKAGLARLGEKERTAIVLRDIEGLDTRQVATILGSSEATVRSQISVGRRKLRKFAEAYLRRRP
jgi:RNA polymerase sigma-70 factor (ECF subfamily)